VLEVITLYLQICGVVALIRAAFVVVPSLAEGAKDAKWWTKPFLVIPFLMFMGQTWFILIFPTIFWPFFLAAIMHHVARFCMSVERARASDPTSWIGVRPLAVRRV
jgi:hypothetical protein